MKNFIWNDVRELGSDAGSKSRSDCVYVITRAGIARQLNVFHGSGLLSRISEAISLLIHVPFASGRKSTHIIQYPIYRFQFIALKIFKKILGWKVFYVIHDLDSYRGLRSRDRERLELSICDAYICNNSLIQDRIREIIGHRPAGVFGFWTYPDRKAPAPQIDDSLQAAEKSLPVIFCAGNLDPRKASYIYSLPNWDGIRLRLFGPNFRPEIAPAHVQEAYEGTFDPDRPPKLVGACFGLVWDGGDDSHASSLYREYLKINVSHRNSLYLSQGIPLVSWENSSTADFITRNKCGLVIRDLNQINKDLLLAAHESMHKQAHAVGLDLREGKTFLEVLSTTLAKI